MSLERSRACCRSGAIVRRLGMMGFAAALAACSAWSTAATVLGAEMPVAHALYQDGPSNRFLLDGTWHGRPDPLDSGIQAGLPRLASLSGWSPTSVPNAANAGDFSQPSYLGGVHWYRKDFLAPRARRPGVRWMLRFESVNYRASVWLNGKLLGRHTGAYLPFELRAHDLRPRRVNRLVVRVDGRRGLLDVPSLALRRNGRFVGGWWNYTGILREVYLRQLDTFDFQNVLVRPNLPCRSCAATIRIEATLQNVSDSQAVATVKSRIDGHELELPSAAIPPGSSRRFAKNVRLAKPRLWSPADPNLYRVRLAVTGLGKRALATYTVHTGVRAFGVDRFGGLLLNYRKVSLRGANMHDDDPVFGAAISPAGIRRNIGLLRELGATMTRAHYPLHPLTVELADRYGIVVWDEIPVYQMQDSLFRSKRVRRQGLGMLREMILRDRNHPSVMVWSVGNENTSRSDGAFRSYVLQAQRLARGLDPKGLVGLAFPGYPTLARQKLYAKMDALGVNDYFGWYPGPQGSIADRQALGPYLDALHSRYPRQALFVTEFGAEANRAGPVGEKGTYEFQQDFLAYHLSVFASKPFLAGAMVWILRDFRVKPGYAGGNPTPSPPLNTKGLIDDSGAKKPSFQVVQGWLRPLSPQGR